MFYPRATYRIQFHKEFTLSDLERIIPYLRQTGISTIYASPIFEAVPESTHGYDGLSPHRINPEIGTEEQLKRISAQLAEAGMSWLQDIVPNHMAFHPGNKWLMDVMEKGRDSAYASFFDIEWDHPVSGDKLMAPFLGSSLEEAIKNGDLRLASEAGKPVLQYFDSSYPVNAPSIAVIHLDGEAPDDMNRNIEAVNRDAELLLRIAGMQYYRLCHWQETDHDINYRRFFTINGLICLNMQDEKVFEAYHGTVKRMVDEGIFQGLRIDHIDGLYDPGAYLQRLKELTGAYTYVVVEKILQADETLPGNWACEGSTGYDFLAIVNNLFTDKQAEDKFTSFYRQLTGNTSIHQQVRDKKAGILHRHMGGELENLYRLFIRSALAGPEGNTAPLLKSAIGEFLVECPVYRYYGSKLPLAKEEEQAIANIFNRIRQAKQELIPAINMLEEAILIKPRIADEHYNQKAAHFYKRCMQFSGPLMAKGVEDTLMYTYNRFIGHNDVGDTPETFGLTTEEVHKKMIGRQKSRPCSINTTSTHDTKRGEDVRARLNVLTDLGDEWLQTVKEWQDLNAGLKIKGAPDGNDEYFIYQTLIGAHPMPGQPAEDFTDRMREYLVKSLREAKTHSDWAAPNEEYEAAVKAFITSLMEEDRPFRKSFNNFLKRVADPGIVNALSQLLLKLTCPGVPDIYQGTELWDLSLVDPDNRRPVDYEARSRLLSDLETSDPESLMKLLWEQRYQGNIKLWLTHTLLRERKSNAELFAEGHYIPLKTAGRLKDHIFAFARRHKDTWYVIAVPLHIARLSRQQKRNPEHIEWSNTRILLRPEMPADFEHLLSGKTGRSSEEIFIRDIFHVLPLAFLKMQQPENDRGAGVLLAISSLPSPFGIGDLGSEAISFLKSLSRGKQKYWQLLPINPTEAGAGHSPYSSYSGMAGNPLLISPELLADEGLLDKELLKAYHLPNTSIADYAGAEQIKRELFDIAYGQFCKEPHDPLCKEFSQFCGQESYWLDDMALYTVLKQHFRERPWYEWDQPFKLRDPEALIQFERAHAGAVRKVKWLQFIFFRQWKRLHTHAGSLSIRLFGDIPFYVSYDSADVWSHPDIFCLDAEGNMTGVAGVPPDYFSETGQLWGMPTFNWNRLKAQDYAWWKLRLRKNLEQFDLLRIDHFRAFQDYWQVPAHEKTAVNGEWIPGPRKEFFDVMKRELGELPFVAEDLGDKMEAVYDLRDQAGLPGMRVLQFAWGENMPQSVDIPHNYTPNSIVYTGTHDNNTTLGWYKAETNKADHQRMHHYLGIKVRQKNIHEILARVAYSSVAKIVILPMQDILGLDEKSRMNTPGKAEGNWLWRLEPGQASERLEAMLRDWTATYNRG